jgi:hypothetical protein
MMRGERVVDDAPPALGVDQPRERVEQGVDVGADVEAMELEIVGDVGDDGQLDRLAQHGEAVRQLRAAGAARQQGDPHRRQRNGGIRWRRASASPR